MHEADAVDSTRGFTDALDMSGRARFLRIAMVVLLAFPPASQAAENFDWPQWRGPRRDGVSKETRWNWDWPKNGPRRLWSQKVGIGWSGVSVANGRVFTMGNVLDLDHVVCLDAATGQILWDFPYFCLAADANGYPGPRCTPTVDGQLVFSLSRNGDLACLRASDGHLMWSYQLVNEMGARIPSLGFACSPLVEGNHVIVETGAPGRSVMAFNKFNGRLVWAGGNDTAGYSSPVAFDFNKQRLVAVFGAHALTMRNAFNGREAWSFPWRTPFDMNAVTPIVSGDKVFISSSHDTGCALLQLSGTNKVVWSNKLMRNHLNSSVLYQGHLYGFDDDKVPQLRCLNMADGTVPWATTVLGRGVVTVAGDKLILYTDFGRLAVAEASPAAYSELASTQVFGRRDTFWIVCACRVCACRNFTDECSISPKS
ncbi:MAG: PQQ-binding-like beta-propeller repeat protein [Verrucomicrobia bacterium]|nr:PQQ-binding-like beta-propeller repeat protein [Verrucomicrobiota bacterium]